MTQPRKPKRPTDARLELTEAEMKKAADEHLNGVAGALSTGATLLENMIRTIPFIPETRLSVCGRAQKKVIARLRIVLDEAERMADAMNTVGELMTRSGVAPNTPPTVVH
ncbi:MAG: hypothetical protein FWD17_02890 [Polyangiaceae bacterium]|nr:hypothetical protein [Polyangiaceae bacterium]